MNTHWTRRQFLRAAFLSADIESVDHRPLQLRTTRGRTEWLDSSRAMDDLIEDARYRVIAVLRSTSRGISLLFRTYRLARDL